MSSTPLLTVVGPVVNRNMTSEWFQSLNVCNKNGFCRLTYTKHVSPSVLYQTNFANWRMRDWWNTAGVRSAINIKIILKIWLTYIFNLVLCRAVIDGVGSKEAILSPQSDQNFKPVGLSLDWLNDHVYILGEVNHRVGFWVEREKFYFDFHIIFAFRKSRIKYHVVI